MGTMRQPLTLTWSDERERCTRRAAMRTRLDAMGDGELDDTALQTLLVAMVDATLSADMDTLEEAFAGIGRLLGHDEPDDDAGRSFTSGWLHALQGLSYWAIERLPASDEVTVNPSTLAGRFLSEIEAHSLQTSSELRQRLHTGESQVSRVGRQLLSAGFVVQRSVGRHAHWEISPRGRQALAAGRAMHPNGGAQPRAGHSARFLKTVSAEPISDDASATLARASARGRQLALTVQHAAGGGWHVSSARRARPLATERTKDAAIERARAHLESRHGGVVRVHGRDGRLQRSMSVAARRAR